MTYKGVLTWPCEALTKVSEPTDLHTASIYLPQMWDILENAPGVGLAAIQIGIPIRLFVMDARNEHKTKYAFMNPEIVEAFGEPVEVEEGCLSVPGVYEKVLRYPEIIIRATNIHKETELRLFQLYGLEAQCAAHEIEHLDGKLFVDSFGRVKKDIIKRKVQKFLRSKAK